MFLKAKKIKSANKIKDKVSTHFLHVRFLGCGSVYLKTAVKNKYSNKAKLRIDFLTVYSTNLLEDKKKTTSKSGTYSYNLFDFGLSTLARTLMYIHF